MNNKTRYISAPFGWGYQLRVLKDSQIINVTERKRMFCIFDKDKPYTGIVTYKPDPVAMWISGEFLGRKIISSVNRNITISYRYATLAELQNDLNTTQQQHNITTEYKKDN
jgi:hypothetical protein